MDPQIRPSTTSLFTIPLSDEDTKGRPSSYSKAGQVGEKKMEASFATKASSFFAQSATYLYGVYKLAEVITAHFQEKAATLTSSGMKVLKATFGFGKTSAKGGMEMTDYPKRHESLAFTLSELNQKIAERNQEQINARKALERNPKFTDNEFDTFVGKIMERSPRAYIEQKELKLIKSKEEPDMEDPLEAKDIHGKDTVSSKIADYHKRAEESASNNREILSNKDGHFEV